MRETFSNAKHVSSALKELKSEDCFTVELSIKNNLRKRKKCIMIAYGNGHFRAIRFLP